MNTFWNTVQPEVWAPGTCDREGYDCECSDPVYGPHIRWVPDPEGHRGTVDPNSLPGKWLAVICECGWRDLDFNHPAHVAESARRRVAVMS